MLGRLTLATNIRINAIFTFNYLELAFISALAAPFFLSKKYWGIHFQCFAILLIFLFLRLSLFALLFIYSCIFRTNPLTFFKQMVRWVFHNYQLLPAFVPLAFGGYYIKKPRQVIYVLYIRSHGR